MKTIVRKIFPVILFATIGYSTLSLAGPFGARDTLHVKLAQNNLMLEAPAGMCFLDQTSSAQSAMFTILAGIAERKKDQVVVAAFMDCGDLGNTESWSEGIPSFGLISWMNPSIGEMTDMERADYLDMREASFPQYAASFGLGGVPDKKAHRTSSDVALGLFLDEPKKKPPRKSTTVIATTVLRHIPVEITVRYSGRDAPTFAEAYPLVDKLVAQQIALNE